MARVRWSAALVRVQARVRGRLVGRVEVAARGTEPESRVMGERVMGDGVAAPRRLMNSSAVLESEVISSALMRVIALLAEGCGVNVTISMQLAEGMMVVQLL